MCLWVKYRVCLRCLSRVANFSEIELWNCWVTWSLGVWLQLFAIGGLKKALKCPLRSPGIKERGTQQSLFLAGENVMSAVPAANCFKAPSVKLIPQDQGNQFTPVSHNSSTIDREKVKIQSCELLSVFYKPWLLALMHLNAGKKQQQKLMSFEHWSELNRSRVTLIWSDSVLSKTASGFLMSLSTPRWILGCIVTGCIWRTLCSSSFLQGRMGRKGFPGKIGPEGDKVLRKSPIFFLLINFNN